MAERLASIAAAVAAKAARTLFARSRFIDRQRPSTLIGFIQAANCLLRGIVVRHFHEPEALATTCIAVLNDLGIFTEPNGENIVSKLALVTS